jgi:hypothetical protein
MKTITWEDFNSPDAQKTQRLLDYYENRQSQYVAKLLDGQRKDWRSKGFNVQSRNIVSMIVDKSGLLFNKPPALAIYEWGSTKGQSDKTFEQLMDRADWQEKFQNVDTYTRLVKTVVLLQQKYIAQNTTTVNRQYKFNARNGDALMLTLLTQANTVVKTDITGNQITELAFVTGGSFDTDWTYRYINGDVIQDWKVAGGEEERIDSQANPDGLVPASVFYDVKQPRAGFWAPVPEDIASFQDNLNLYLCDLQYAIAYQVNPTLFMDTDIVSTSTSPTAVIPIAPPGHTNAGDEQWNQLSAATQKNIGGLGSIVQVQPGMSGSKPLVEYVGTDTKLKEMHDILVQQVKDIAADWDVTVQAEGGARANSGFQVIVEEMDNLALRERRGQSFQAGLRRFYDITQVLYPELLEGILKAEFAPPTLPVNRLEQEQVWTYRMQNGFGTPVDYWMEQGYTEADALEKVKADLALRKQLGLPIPGAPVDGQDGVAAPNPRVSPSNMSQRGGNPHDPKNA